MVQANPHKTTRRPMYVKGVIYRLENGTANNSRHWQDNRVAYVPKDSTAMLCHDESNHVVYKIHQCIKGIKRTGGPVARNPFSRAFQGWGLAVYAPAIVLTRPQQDRTPRRTARKFVPRCSRIVAPDERDGQKGDKQKRHKKLVKRYLEAEKPHVQRLPGTEHTLFVHRRQGHRNVGRCVNEAGVLAVLGPRSPVLLQGVPLTLMHAPTNINAAPARAIFCTDDAK